jgi:hypothetical protein
MLVLLLGLPAAAQADAAEPATPAQQIADLTAQKDKAVERVKAIVNQPVTHVPRSPWASVQIFRPGWFHPGAKVPDFNTVDVRTTQELPYARYQYVSSDINPREMFLGPQLEFNAMTKLFYMDRNLPKKRLSEAEMLEINRLYRIIGNSLDKIAEIQKASEFTLIKVFNNIFVQLALMLLAFTFLYRKFFVRRY